MTFMRIALTVVLIVIVALAVSTWITYDPNGKLQNQTDTHDVKITAFSMDKGWENPGGLLLTCWFNITLSNIGLDDFDGLKLRVQMFVNDSKVDVLNDIHGVYDNGSIIDALRAGEVREVKGELMYSLHVGGAIETIGGHPIGATYVAKVMLDGVVWDERWAT